MIITHTTNAKGQRRVYLGGKSSLECWVEPQADGVAWTFHVEPAVTGNALQADEQRQCAIQTLVRLAHRLEVAPADLKPVPFDRIAALHTGNPFEYRRTAVPRSKSMEHCYMASDPLRDGPKSRAYPDQKDRNARR